jgi:hypothetical protein
MAEGLRAGNVLLEERPKKASPSQKERMDARSIDEVIKQTVNEIVAAFGSKKKISASVKNSR